MFLFWKHAISSAKLEQTIRSKGHEIILERVEPVNNNPRSGDPVRVKTAPDISTYDAVIFASPVQAFSLAPLMRLYLSKVSGLTGKKVYCFVTQRLKKPWLGGNRAVRQIKKICKAKGADIILSGVVNWSGSTRDNQIEDIVSRLSII
ncbi:hypothetical protein OXPF_24910 [Oxobacter pfennigii]|uniref:Flavodoxin n=1 Tax=Oxobacter pfennigii TaxID=36849 RepID=A0A0P9AG10_9CLOT|nr:hypothetical protein [Oxobacter pfennigii]KPU44321.1 hypothetical protein OXPF_24910 [Oxobacter pfennigii]